MSATDGALHEGKREWRGLSGANLERCGAPPLTIWSPDRTK